MNKLKATTLICLCITVISCQDDKTRQQYEKDKKVIESEVGQIIESTKQAAEDAAVKAQEQAEEVKTIIEDTAIEIQEGAEEAKEDLEDVLSD